MSFVVKIQGEVGVGKSTLALTFPKPLRHLDTDVGGFERAAWRFEDEMKSGSIRSTSYHVPQQSIKDKLMGNKQANRIVGMKELWYRMLGDYVVASEDKSVSTVVWDSWTRVWNLCTSAFLEEKQEKDVNRTRLLEVEYTEPNLRMVALIDAAREAGKNLVLVCHLTDERKDYPTGDGVKSLLTGRRIADNWKRTDQLVDMIVAVELEKNAPKATILQSKVVLDLTGMNYQNPSWELVDATVRMMRGG